MKVNGAALTKLAEESTSQERPRTILDRARDALNARMTKDDLRLVLENVITHAAALAEQRDSFRLQLNELSGEYERLNPQQRKAGKHADWLVDSEYAHTCPWCEIERLKAEADLCSDCGHVERAHSKDGEADCTASGARVRPCTCSFFIPGGAA